METFTLITNDEQKDMDPLYLFQAQGNNRLGKLLPSGANIPFVLYTGEKSTFTIGKSRTQTYLIMCIPPDMKEEIGDVSWRDPVINARVREQIFGYLPETFRHLAIQIRQATYGKEPSCLDKTFLMPFEQVIENRRGMREDVRFDFQRDGLDGYRRKMNKILSDGLPAAVPDSEFALGVMDALTTRARMTWETYNLIKDSSDNIFFGVGIDSSQATNQLVASLSPDESDDTKNHDEDDEDVYSDGYTSLDEREREKVLNLIKEKEELYHFAKSVLFVSTFEAICIGVVLIIYLSKILAASTPSPLMFICLLASSTVLMVSGTVITRAKAKKHLEELKEGHKILISSDVIEEYTEREYEKTQGPREYLEVLRGFRNKVMDQSIVEHLQQIEETLQRIIIKEENDPSTSYNTRKLMEYYMPTTIKLLQAYVEVEDNPRKGASASKIIQETKDAIKLLSQTMENILDNMYLDTELDIASDISAMKNLMLQDEAKSKFDRLQVGTLAKDGNIKKL